MAGANRTGELADKVMAGTEDDLDVLAGMMVDEVLCLPDADKRATLVRWARAVLLHRSNRHRQTAGAWDRYERDSGEHDQLPPPPMPPRRANPSKRDVYRPAYMFLKERATLDGRLVEVGAMTADELRRCAEQRRKQAAGQLWWARLFDGLSVEITNAGVVRPSELDVDALQRAFDGAGER